MRDHRSWLGQIGNHFGQGNAGDFLLESSHTLTAQLINELVDGLVGLVDVVADGAIGGLDQRRRLGDEFTAARLGITQCRKKGGQS